MVTGTNLGSTTKDHDPQPMAKTHDPISKLVPTSETMSLKLIVDMKYDKVLFAEAQSGFVDFLLHFLTLPMGTLVKLLCEKEMGGCLGDLYKSIEALNTRYFQSNFDVNVLLKPQTKFSIPLITDNPTFKTLFYKCSEHESFNNFIIDVRGRACPGCRGPMSAELGYVVPESYVEGVFSYMVMDNLEIEPITTLTTISLLKKFRIKDTSSLIEKDVQIGIDEGLRLLKASLLTKDVLTTVFLDKNSGI